MAKNKLTRRDFSKLTLTALGGIAAGTVVGCGGPAKDGGKDGDKDGKGADANDGSQ